MGNFIFSKRKAYQYWCKRNFYAINFPDEKSSMINSNNRWKKMLAIYWSEFSKWVIRILLLEYFFQNNTIGRFKYDIGHLSIDRIIEYNIKHPFIH